ncbi:GntR family transcriptional regulator, partial [Burkholderia pseudomallei]
MARRARIIEIPSLGMLERTAGNLSRQLAQALRDAVRRGEVMPGDALPSTRLLAASLRIARGTVIDAYEQLIAEGFLESRGGVGTRVAPALAEPRGARRRAAAAARSALPPPAAEYARVAREFAPLPPAPFAIS